MMKFTQLPLRVLRWPIQAGLLLTLTALGAGCGGTDTPPPVEESNPPVEGESPTPVPVTPSVIPATPTSTETPGVSPTAQVTPTPASPTDEPATPTATATAAPATPTSAPATPTLVPETPTVPPTPTATPSALDEDQDGSHPPQDCNDQDGTIYPGAAEIPYDGIDQDCADGDLNDLDKDGALGGTTGTDCDDQDPARAPGKSEIPYDDIDQDCTGADLVDVDGDGVPGGPNGQDCDDTNPAKSPNATEVPYDGIDQDCSGSDANDLDNDGYIGGTLGTDCDDTDASVNPGKAEIPYDSVDQDCSGSDLTDQDKDGALGGSAGTDCDDLDPSRSPSFEEIPYNDIDDDCDGVDLTDVDEDGRDATEAGGNDCDDDDPTIYSGATEIPYDGIDQDCTGKDLNDVDADSYIGIPAGGNDCNDTNANVYPGAPEFADSLDNDCDGRIDEELSSTDDDLDGYSELTGDCNDANASIHPGATEVPYDGIDQNCSGGDLTDQDSDGYAGGTSGSDCNDKDASINPGKAEVAYDGIDQDCSGSDLVDVDGDGYASTAVSGGTDCNDGAPLIHPGQTETCNNTDDDCDGQKDENASDAPVFYTDADGDTYGNASSPVRVCTASGNLVSNATDCNDAAATTYPGAPELCDGADNNCNSSIDEGVKATFYLDADGDGYGNPSKSTQACAAPEGYVTDNTDCKDSNDLIHPGATEICNSVDDDCDAQIDEGVKSTWYQDSDRDSFGNPSVAQTTCNQPTGYVPDNTDCDDTNRLINPAAVEVCDGVDNNCVSGADENLTITGYTDRDNDSYGSSSSATAICPGTTGYVTRGGDCNDSSAAIYPGATETCNSVDDDCDSEIDEGVKQTWYLDLDEDGYGNPSKSTQACTQPTGYVSNGTDCKDNNDSIHPGATEFCNNVDDDCDGQVDDGALQTYYQDADHDGFGNPTQSQTSCTAVSGYVLSNTDCNDNNASINPNGTEVCNRADDDCDGSTDEGVTTTYYADTDADGYGNPNSTTQACSVPTGYASNNTDCNDSSSSVNPGRSEICNGIDDNCNTQIDEGVKTTYYEDIDRDGYGNPSSSVQACSQPTGYVTNNTDCRDTNDAINPGKTELCNGIDDNCNNVVDDLDADRDGHRPTACGGDDCNDAEPNAYSGAPEVCDDGIDNDCNGRDNNCYGTATFGTAKYHP